jgi:hypothetical protein
MSWDDARPIGFFAASACWFGHVCEVSFVSGEPALPLIRVVRFSRLIGNFDSTGYRSRAQVAPPTLRYRRNCAATPWYSGAPIVTLLTRTKRHPFEWRFASLRWSLASQQIMGGGYIHRAFHRLSRPVYRFFGGCSCRASAVFAGSPEFSQQPVHHWHPPK